MSHVGLGVGRGSRESSRWLKAKRGVGQLAARDAPTPVWVVLKQEKRCNSTVKKCCPAGLLGRRREGTDLFFRGLMGVGDKGAFSYAFYVGFEAAQAAGTAWARPAHGSQNLLPQKANAPKARVLDVRAGASEQGLRFALRGLRTASKGGRSEWPARHRAV